MTIDVVVTARFRIENLVSEKTLEVEREHGGDLRSIAEAVIRSETVAGVYDHDMGFEVVDVERDES